MARTVLDNLNRWIAPLRRRVFYMVARCVVRAIDDDPKLQELQVQVLNGVTRSRLERFQHYGLTSHPHDDAEGVVLFQGGNTDHGLVIAVDDRRYRLVGLEQGEVALYTDEGDKVHLKRSKEILVQSGNLVTVNATNEVRLTAPLVKVIGDLEVQGETTLKGDTEVALGRDLKVTGDLRVEGDVEGEQEVWKDFGLPTALNITAIRNTYNLHTHLAGVPPGSTGPPNPPLLP